MNGELYLFHSVKTDSFLFRSAILSFFCLLLILSQWQNEYTNWDIKCKNSQFSYSHSHLESRVDFTRSEYEPKSSTSTRNRLSCGGHAHYNEHSDAYVIIYHGIWNIRRNFLHTQRFLHVNGKNEQNPVDVMPVVFWFALTFKTRKRWIKIEKPIEQSKQSDVRCRFTIPRSTSDIGSQFLDRILIRNAFKLIRKINSQMWLKFWVL